MRIAALPSMFMKFVLSSDRHGFAANASLPRPTALVGRGVDRR
jgi:hypothetical protein